ncbi:LysR family transcriptional regulator [Streptomyces lincolnensis]|uniref:LysR family transcriptional regulator n=1 Tax=Streptomyces lincolnensis TaxID=1915 RepID=A0A1B1M3V8_STRLN|nr:LysR family transcriptional regulator [Streptomyces lincolnensis]ANS63351.1 LysR family transcriptional regulator [Streptomyces lincolnensis]AXG52273.1 LysR family transcriptional regulator [Streptomyces lincolnensis]QMV05244.1 LysR family transcriptional regulator [Streptomyces lincolnensis]
MDVTLRQLTAYAAVARAVSFTAAAAEMHVSQSSLSRAVAELERTLGMRLLERDTRNVQLTPAGAEALRIADQILATHRAGIAQLGRYVAGERGTVALATLPSLAAVLLPPVISAFRDRRPEVTVRILDGLERAALARVVDGDVDFAITTVARPRTRGLDLRPLVRDRFDAVLPEGHPLAEREQVTWQELGREPFLAVGADSSVRRITDAAFAQAGVETHPAAEAGNVATVGGLVAAGLGVSAMPGLVHPLVPPGRWVRRPLVSPVVERRLYVVLPVRRTPPPGARGFLEQLEEFRTSSYELPDGVSWEDGTTEPSHAVSA